MKEIGKECLKSTIYESSLSTAPRSPFLDGKGLVVEIAAIRGERISNIRGGANPVSLRQAAPSRGRGENVGRFECIYPSFLWKEVPAGRRLGAQSGVKDDVRLSIFLGKR